MKMQAVRQAMKCRHRCCPVVFLVRNHPQAFATLVNSAMEEGAAPKPECPSSFFIDGALTMKTLNAIDPARMTIEERRTEVASILALGVIRLRTKSEPSAEERELPDLGFSSPQRVHTNPSSRVRSAVREALLAKQKGV
jgi:hypothetical protein